MPKKIKRTKTERMIDEIVNNRVHSVLLTEIRKSRQSVLNARKSVDRQTARINGYKMLPEPEIIDVEAEESEEG